MSKLGDIPHCDGAGHICEFDNLVITNPIPYFIFIVLLNVVIFNSKKSRVCEQCFVVHQHAYEVDQTLTTTLPTPDSDDDTRLETLATSRSFIGSNNQLSHELESTEATSSKEGSSSTDGSISPVKVSSGLAVEEETSPDNQGVCEVSAIVSLTKTSTQDEPTTVKEGKQNTSSTKVEAGQLTGSELR